MPRFNKPKVSEARQLTSNLAGGVAYTMDAKTELASILVTSLAQDQYYREAGDPYNPAANSTFGRLKELLAKVDPLFAAQAAVYARTVIGTRSITQYMAYLIGRYGMHPWRKDAKWSLHGHGRNFFKRVVRRPDDMLEMAALFLGDGKALPHAARKAWAEVISNLTPYALAKYRGEGHTVKMVDLVNLLHVKGTKTFTVHAGSDADLLRKRGFEVDEFGVVTLTAVEALSLGLLKQQDTWEDKLTSAGEAVKDIEDEDEKAAALADGKAEAWKELIDNDKLGYFALVRNLRNMIAQADEATFEKALTMLVDPEAVSKSLLFPSRFLSAFDALAIDRTTRAVRAKQALSKAATLSTKNVPAFEGRVAVFLDSSGSMMGKPVTDASMLALPLMYANPTARMWLFSNGITEWKPIGVDLLSDVHRLKDSFEAAGTDFTQIISVLRKEPPFDVVIVLTDQQAWVTQQSMWYRGEPPFQTYMKQYLNDHGSTLFMFDLTGYGSMQAFGKGVYHLFGYTDQVFQTMQKLGDPAAIVREIESIVL